MQPKLFAMEAMPFSMLFSVFMMLVIMPFRPSMTELPLPAEDEELLLMLEDTELEEDEDADEATLLDDADEVAFSTAFRTSFTFSTGATFGAQTPGTTPVVSEVQTVPGAQSLGE